jgi:hypothetical protein
MKNKLFICIVAALALVGCAPPSPQEIAAMQAKMEAENQTRSSNPTLVATTPQGNLYLIFVRPYPRNESRYDRVYFFDTNATVSINAEVKHGKHNVTETSVLINGKEYVPKH